ncbi:uncharacterized protein RAG0_07863 [Rhynchosporium agropyri]|uniref:Uncharacterized protein n=1 Tax=Rhynchosporium agropyri TaxID=914238 RepID=A0A1E1KND0_9HELO|nr:uncharacterized protein RAG0_07863 [Rhynchosporium agropyri]
MALAERTAELEQPEPPKVNYKPETVQKPSINPSTDPAIVESLRANSPIWNNLPVHFELTGSEERK